MKDILRKVSLSFLANFFSALTSVIMVFLLPKVMPIKDYGMWQLFLFYFSYVGLFHLGWIDGIYLRYGGQYYEGLDKKTFNGQFFLIIFFLVIEATLVNITFSLLEIEDTFLLFSIPLLCIAGVLYNLVTFSNYILQMTGRIKEYARNVVLEKVVLLALVILLVIVKATNYNDMIFAKITSIVITAVFTIYCIKDLIFAESGLLIDNLKEAWINIRVGSKLMISNIASMLILGIIRFGISQRWDIETFGKVSLTLSVSNFLMLFISAVSVVLFPILKRINEDSLVKVYLLIQRLLSISTLALLISYYPLYWLLSYWLPKYSDSLVFMGYLLPICIFESKMQLLVNTYLKSLRQELLMLKINFVSVLIALSLTYITVVLLHDLHYTVLAIVFNFAIRLFIAQYYLENLLCLNLVSDRIGELLLVLLFITLNIYDVSYGIFVYLFAYCVYLWINKKQVMDSFCFIKNKFVK